MARAVALAGLAAVAVLTQLTGCGELPLFPGTLSVSPDSLTVVEGSIVTLTRTGGYEPISWTVSGSGTFNPVTLEYTAPSGSDSVVISAEDLDSETDSVEITVFAMFSISPTSATVGVSTTFPTPFTVSGGVPPYSFSVTSGSVSQAGAEVTYTAPDATESGIVLTAEDSIGNIAEATIAVVPVGDLIVNPPSATLAVADSYQDFTVSGGTEPYSWTLIWDPLLVPDPGSLTTISPTVFRYTDPDLATNVTVRVTDSTAIQKTVDVPITVVFKPLTLAPSKVTTRPGQQTVFTAAGGVPPYSWVVEGAGTITQRAGAQVVYTAPNAVGTTDLVKVTDSEGMFRRTRVQIE